MVKELNNMKNKKSNSYKPYDSSNSFVRRVTSRVSQLLPQPTSWISRFLSSRTPEDAEPIDSQEAEDEEVVVRPPPSKRMRTVQTITDFPIYQNSTGPSDLHRIDEKREEELSPIRRYKFASLGVQSRAGTSGGVEADAELAGPSGLSRHHRFVASTPAEPAFSQQPQHKLNGDDCSDSDSVSHGSSLPPDAGDQEPLSLFRSLSKPRPTRRAATNDEHNSLLRSKQLKLDLSTSSLSSSRGRVSFDTTVFNSPFKGRLCGGLSVSREEATESPFYRSSTTFGGASSCNDSLLRTRSLHSEVPIIVQPSRPVRTSDNLGSSTRKILKALEQFSTPMLESSRMHVRDRGMKRKVEVPYKELVIPQMPDLLRIKRRDARQARQNSLKISSSLGTGSLPSTTSTEALVSPTSDRNFAASSEYVSKSSSSQLSLRLGKYAESNKDKSDISTERRSEETKKSVQGPQSLPMAALPLYSLPKFDPGMVKAVSSVPISPSNKPSSNQFRFSKPISVTEDGSYLSSIPLSKKFSAPLNANSRESSDAAPENKSLANCVKVPSSVGAEITMTYSPPTDIRLKRKEPQVDTVKKPVISTQSELKSGSVLDALKKPVACISSELKNSGTVMDVLRNNNQDSNKKAVKSDKWECGGCYVSNDGSRTNCVACEQPNKSNKSKQPEVKENSTGFGDKFKMSKNEWECSGCLVRNSVKLSKCMACDQSNPNIKSNNSVEVSKPPVKSQTLVGFGDKFKPPAGSWECSECLVQNKGTDTKCVSCCADKPGSVGQTSSSVEKSSAAPPLSNLFKKPEGSWECDTCLVRNKNEATGCVSCGTDRPGHKAPPPTAGSGFSFGVSPSASDATPKFTFGIPAGQAEIPVNPTYTFGMPQSSVPSTQTDTPTFTFGIPTANETKSSPANSLPSSVTNPKTNSLEKKSLFGPGTSKSSENEKSTSEIAIAKSEPTFPFGTPSTKESTLGSLGSNAKPIFGNVTTTSSVTTTSTTGFVLSSSASTVSAPSNLPIFVNQISSTKTQMSSAHKPSVTATTNPIFTFGSSSISMGTINKTPTGGESVKPQVSSAPLFTATSGESEPMFTSPVNKLSSGHNSVGKSESSGFGGSEPKLNMFAFGGSGPVTEKKPAQVNSNSGESPSLVFNSSTVNSFNTQQSSAKAPVKPMFTFTGFTGVPDNSQTKQVPPVNSFTTQQQPSSVGGFNFKTPETTFAFPQKKPEPQTPAFQFGASPNNHTNSFGSSTPSTTPFNSSFGSSATNPPAFSTQGSIFGASAPQPVETASFMFGASQANDRATPSPSFNFTAQGGSNTGNSVGNTAVAGGFAFGQTQNSAPVQPPAFDPNIKPVFNFSGGQTPTFSATATGGGPTVSTERKIRRAVRRTTQK